MALAQRTQAVIMGKKTYEILAPDYLPLGHTEAVIIGGTDTVSQFLEAGLVNELYLVIEPVLFDGGLPLLNNTGRDFKLQLSGMQQLNENTVQLHYHISK